MDKLKNTKKALGNVFYSFPFQLLVNHFKKNQILIFLWLFLFAVITQNFGSVFGIPYLFLDPEYMDKVSIKSFAILGISFGILITAFHITTYILDSFRFPFLGTVRRPFTKFCLNNSIIPFIFVLIYIICVARFQFTNGFQTNGEIFLEIIVLLVSLSLTLTLIFLYFTTTNKDIYKDIAQNLEQKLKRNTITRVNVLRKINNAKKNKYTVTNYFDLDGSIQKVSLFNTYDKEALLKIFDQNHLNAVIFEIFVILIIIVLGLFRDNNYFQIPAAASAILFFSILVMFTGAFSYWLRGWAITALFCLFLILNFLVKLDVIKSAYQAYGLNYNTTPVKYSLDKLNEISNSENYLGDHKKTVKILENWKNKFPKNKKPKMIFICSSGGGQRAAVWTIRTLQYVDSSLNGNLMKNTMLMTGASGGIIGASYFRELCLRQAEGKKINIYDPLYTDNISRDILNPIIFSLVVNDLFFKFQKYDDGKYKYLKDRGYAFEQQFNKNTEYFLNKPLMEYKIPEEKAIIPMTIISPTIINDGRKLFISPQNVSYLTHGSKTTQRVFDQEIKGIEFLRFFENHDATNLSFISALRMSATFPYITPNVELPSDPAMEIMDAGLTDNFGIHDAVKFLYVFKDWISENTGGVIFVVIRDSEKQSAIEKRPSASITQKIFSPIGGLYNTWDYLQDFNNDDLLEFSQTWYDGQLNIINFEYIPKPKFWEALKEKKIDPKEVEKNNVSERAALSWHLTTREKLSLKGTILESNNQAAIIRLKGLLEN